MSPFLSLCGDLLSPPGLVEPLVPYTTALSVQARCYPSDRWFSVCMGQPRIPLLQQASMAWPPGESSEIWLRPDILIYSQHPPLWSLS